MLRRSNAGSLVLLWLALTRVVAERERKSGTTRPLHNGEGKTEVALGRSMRARAMADAVRILWMDVHNGVDEPKKLFRWTLAWVRIRRGVEFGDIGCGEV